MQHIWHFRGIYWRINCLCIIRIYEKITPIKLALGMAIHLFFSSLTQGIIILNEDSNTTVMFWLVGSLNGLKWTAVLSVMPLLILALIITMLLGRQLTIMELGDDIAKGLGQKTQLIRIIVGLLVIVLAVHLFQ